MRKADMLLDLIMSRRSIRFFKDDPIPDEHVKMILEAARWAPSPANAQPWEFIIIKDPRVKEDLQNVMRRVGTAVRERYPQFPWGATPRDPELISKVPVVVVVCADFDKKELRKYDMFPSEHKKELVSCGVAAAIQNMILMATALGLGSLWVSPLFTEDIKRLLGIPQTLKLVALVPLGYPIRHLAGKALRRPLETMVRYDKFSSCISP